MIVDVACPVCSTNPETDDHLFMHCTTEKLVLFASLLGAHVPVDTDLKTSGLRMDNLQGTTRCSIILYNVMEDLSERNQILVKQKVSNPVEVAWSSSRLSEFNQANLTTQSSET